MCLVRSMATNHKMKAIRDDDHGLHVNDFDSHLHLVRAYPLKLPVMSSSHEIIAHLQERHAKLLPTAHFFSQTKLVN